MALDKLKQYNRWCVRRPDGSLLRLDSERAADEMLSLWARIEKLEAQVAELQTRGRRKASDGNS